MAASVDPVQHQQVKVDVQVQRAAEALDQGHGARLRVGLFMPCLADQVRGDRPVDDAEHGRQGGRFRGKQEAQRERHAQHPLAQWLPGGEIRGAGRCSRQGLLHLGSVLGVCRAGFRGGRLGGCGV